VLALALMVEAEVLASADVSRDVNACERRGSLVSWSSWHQARVWQKRTVIGWRKCVLVRVLVRFHVAFRLHSSPSGLASRLGHGELHPAVQCMAPALSGL
jgi:hypothetical protein